MAQADDDKKDETTIESVEGEDSQAGATEGDTPDEVDSEQELQDDEAREAVDTAEPDEAPTAEDTDAEPPESDTSDVTDLPDADLDTETPDSVAASEDGDSLPAEDTPEAPTEPTPAPPPEVIRETVVERKGGFFPMLLGGLVAAGLGYGAASYAPGAISFLPAPPPSPFEAEARAALDEQMAQIEAVGGQAATTAEAVAAIDLEPISGAISALQGQVAGIEDSLTALTEASAELDTQVAAFDSRLTAAEKQPLANALSPEAIAAYERELEELRTAITTQQATLDNTITPEAIATIQSQIADLGSAVAGAVTPDITDKLGEDIAAVASAVEAQSAEIAGVAEQAQTLRAEAEEQAARARSAAALADITVAMQSGAPFADAVTAVEANGIAVPDALKAVAADGVAAQAALIEEFPPLAREALRAVRSSGGETSDGSVAGFLRTQLGGRSVAPREGNDADAVLSRVEAAVRGGDLGTALTEISALDGPAAEILSDWVDNVKMREAALAAAETLVSDNNQ